MTGRSYRKDAYVLEGELSVTREEELASVGQ
jgi:hypothetical protein